MTRDRDIEQVLEHWLTDGASEMPDRVYQAIFDRVERQPQAVRPRLVRRLPAMNYPMRFVAATAAVIAIALVTFSLLGGRGSPAVGGPAASPTATPSPSPSPTASTSECGYGELAGLPGCAGSLAAGEHRSTNFDPAMSFQTPDGWENNVDIPAWYELRHGDQAIIMWSEVVAAYQGETCSAVQKVDFGGSVQDWIDYLTSHPGLVTSEPVPVTLGAATGQAIDISVAPDWTKGCQDNPAGSGPQVMLFIQGPGASQKVFYGIAAPDRMHLTFVDVGGRTVVIAVYGPESPGSFAAVVADVRPVIESMRYTP